eukprot:gnl/TRDRNA2_/TRDRNA2_163764_c0_seq1.p1 gnl/TRDRNA2_/TRDRNA2_163764_c0~~gnl/TRDRNA2_/TRDRNA2_163764_c0_seq1.p1  ORF type:complete len:276 (-),score=17.92 gnl/TRDRNA2_/TRDRNA2_163764_c0_seq1:38-799(-)
MSASSASSYASSACSASSDSPAIVCPSSVKDLREAEIRVGSLTALLYDEHGAAVDVLELATARRYASVRDLLSIKAAGWASLGSVRHRHSWKDCKPCIFQNSRRQRRRNESYRRPCFKGVLCERCHSDHGNEKALADTPRSQQELSKAPAGLQASGDTQWPDTISAEQNRDEETVLAGDPVADDTAIKKLLLVVQNGASTVASARERKREPDGLSWRAGTTATGNFRYSRMKGSKSGIPRSGRAPRSSGLKDR